MEGERTLLSPVLRPVERGDLPRLRHRRDVRAGLEGLRDRGPGVRRSWRSWLATSCCGCRTYCRSIQRARPAMSPDLAFNTSVSFETNTNWQNYSGETGVSYLTQMAMLAVRNFTSAATGLAVAIALYPRPDPAQREDPRQLLGRPDPRRAVRPAADLDRRRDRPRLAGRAADVGSGPCRDDSAGHPTEHRARPGRLPGVDQGAGQQRRRLLQCQLCPSVREPDAL